MGRTHKAVTNMMKIILSALAFLTLTQAEENECNPFFERNCYRSVREWVNMCMDKAEEKYWDILKSLSTKSEKKELMKDDILQCLKDRSVESNIYDPIHGEFCYACSLVLYERWS